MIVNIEVSMFPKNLPTYIQMCNTNNKYQEMIQQTTLFIKTNKYQR